MKLGTLSAAHSLLMSTTALAETTRSAPAPVVVPASPSSTTVGPSGSSWGGTQVSGWFLAPTFGTTVFGDRVSYTPGLRGGVYLDKRFAIGVTAQGRSTPGPRSKMTPCGTSEPTVVFFSSTSCGRISGSRSPAAGRLLW